MKGSSKKKKKHSTNWHFGIAVSAIVRDISEVTACQTLQILQELKMGPGVGQWLRRCATSRTVPGSIPGNVTGYFSDIFPSDQTMALGSTQPLVKMSTGNIPGSKGGRCVRLTTYHHTVKKSGSFNFLDPFGPARPVMGELYLTKDE